MGINKWVGTEPIGVTVEPSNDSRLERFVVLNLTNGVAVTVPPGSEWTPMSIYGIFNGAAGDFQAWIFIQRENAGGYDYIWSRHIIMVGVLGGLELNACHGINDNQNDIAGWSLFALPDYTMKQGDRFTLIVQVGSMLDCDFHVIEKAVIR
jgi:hypothetical protein